MRQFSPRHAMVVVATGCVAALLTALTPVTVQAAPREEIDLRKARAVWVGADRVVWPAAIWSMDSYQLRYDPAGQIRVDNGQVVGGTALDLRHDPAGLPDPVAARYPHLRGRPVFRLAAGDAAKVDQAVRGQVVVTHQRGDRSLAEASGVQLAPVLDERYAPAAKSLAYGPVFTGQGVQLRLWAPTAATVRLRLFTTRAPAAAEQPAQVLDLQRHDASGSWTLTGPADWRDRYYQYEVAAWQPATGRVETARVTDPYAVALAVDSTHAQLADLDQQRTMPANWRQQLARGLGEDPTEHPVTELHVRDFSIGDQSVPAAERGSYLAFTRRDSTGMRHLRRLVEAGMDTVHLQPTFDLSTVPERPGDQATPGCDLKSLPADSEEQQRCVGASAARDAFNWGYDPFHYDVPEGSYATAEARSGWARSRQYRQMVKGLHDIGARVVVDVVYNHTVAAGNAPESVLDRVVPGYYHRLLEDGAVATSTCCANTAPENAMMGKLVVDSTVRWARWYKVDGFRFDLMGHHPKANILAVRAALDQLTPAKDGVDGRRIRIYGEGWNFGEVVNNARFVQATQHNMAGTGIGTFSDRLRDAVRGGGPFDADPRGQGLASGLAGAVNGSPPNGGEHDQAARLENYADLVKLGMAGNLADFRFRATSGATVTGRQVGYNGSPAGYTATPADVITYVDAHDNETLYDALAVKLRTDTSMADRVRMQVLGLAPALLGQGQPLVLAGSEFLRSKSFDRNSYDSGDWFNRYDPSLTASTFGSGLPPARDNGDKWWAYRPLLADPALRPAPTDLRTAVDRTVDLLRLRRSSQLFTLGDAAQVQAKLSFPDPGSRAGRGVVLAHLDDRAGSAVDPARDGLLVVVNPYPTEQTVGAPTGGGWRLHSVQAAGSDPVVKGTRVVGETVTVPGRTVAVLER